MIDAGEQAKGLPIEDAVALEIARTELGWSLRWEDLSGFKPVLEKYRRLAAGALAVFRALERADAPVATLREIFETMDAAAHRFAWTCVCGERFEWQEIAQFDEPGRKEQQEHRRTCKSLRGLFKKGDIVSERGFRGEYEVLHYDAARGELRIARNGHECMMGSWNAYVVRRPTKWVEFPKPQDADQVPWQGSAIRCTHGGYYGD